ncbi:plasmid maintenance protein CcdB [candidate division MSBL1 archaeon SCGC-AAA385M11]|nr:plasmid maintenance protein CcdB [candidate division MSBL1 archaeon SCGC-AAA385M11]
MAQFDVYENPNPATNEEIPYLLDVQSDLLDLLSTRVVVPLVVTISAGQPIKQLTPKFTVNETSVLMSTAELAGIPIQSIGERIGTLKDKRDEIIAALDFLFTGF